MYQSLYRTYRPLRFAELEGQQHVKQTLTAALEQQKVAHAYLFAGPRGTGKTTTARIVAKSLNCASPTKEGLACDQCDFCLEANEGKAIDIIEIDAASNRGIDEIRALRENVKFAPTKSKKKVYIIDEVHMLSRDAANALLKTLEEPPAHVHFILATTEAHKILPTIISRCQFFTFLPLQEEDLVHRLEHIIASEHKTVDKAVLSAIARHAEGGVRDAITLLERIIHQESASTEELLQTLGLRHEALYEDIAHAFLTRDSQKLFTNLDDLTSQGEHAETFLRGFLKYTHKKFREAVLSQSQDVATLKQLLETIQESLARVKVATLPFLYFELSLATLLSPEVSINTDLGPSPRVQGAAPKATEATPPKRPEISQAPKVKVTPTQAKENVPLTSPHSVEHNAPASAPEPSEADLDTIAKLFGGEITS